MVLSAVLRARTTSADLPPGLVGNYVLVEVRAHQTGEDDKICLAHNAPVVLFADMDGLMRDVLNVCTCPANFVVVEVLVFILATDYLVGVGLLHDEGPLRQEGGARR